MEIEQKLYEAVTLFIQKRYPTGWGGAAALYTEDGEILLSVAPEVNNAGVELCMETGAICEAHKWEKKVTHSLCVVRDNELARFQVLTPCGVCQERLFYWGEEVRCGVTNQGNELEFQPLKVIQPYYWYKAYQNKT